MVESKQTIPHYVSATIESGAYSKLMRKAPLSDILKEAIMKAPDRKEDCWLISSGYSDRGGKYTRAEFNFQYIDTVLIDCDNPDSDPDLMERFKAKYSDYAYFLWETASSTEKRPKFRAIILLDERIPWHDEPKWTKKAIFQLFHEWTDDKASWYFTPTKGKLGTFVCHKGKPYPSSEITAIVECMMMAEEATRPSTAGEWDIAMNRPTRKFNPEGWRNLPTVKKCLAGLSEGERDNSLCAACYAMDKNGYRSSIQEFLDECDVPMEFKKKWRNRYR